MIVVNVKMTKWITQEFNTDQTLQDNFNRVKPCLSITPNTQYQIISHILKNQIYYKQSHQQYIIYLKNQYLTHNHHSSKHTTKDYASHN